MNADLCFLPAAEVAGRIRTRDISPVELTRAVLERIERHDGRVNAFAHLAPDLALDMAKAAEDAVLRGDELGPLHGVPVTIKDLHQLAGHPLALGSLTQAGQVADFDAPVTARLKAARAGVLGKPTTPGLGGAGVSRSPLTGITHNPWKHGLNAGGSSTGAAAAAAGGVGPRHQGDDGAGSIRMPSHFCGVFGLKPTWGTIPHVPVRNNDNVSHIGPIGRTVADAALFLNATAGAHPFDHTSLTGPPTDYLAGLAEDVHDLRIAFSPDLGHARVDPEVADPVRAAVAAFESFGCHVEEVVPEWGPEGPEIGRFFWAVHEAPLAPLLAEWEDRMDAGLVACIRAGMGHSADDYIAMRARKLAYVERMHRFMAEWDVLLTPTVSVAAFPPERIEPAHWPEHPWDWIRWAEFSYPFNMSGLPAASVPCGFTPDGLPVGLQIVGRRGADAEVLRAAATFERARPWAQLRPPL